MFIKAVIKDQMLESANLKQIIEAICDERCEERCIPYGTTEWGMERWRFGKTKFLISTNVDIKRAINIARSYFALKAIPPNIRYVLYKK